MASISAAPLSSCWWPWWPFRLEFPWSRFFFKKEASDEFIETLLNWCEEHNFINEQRYCEGFVRKHIFKGHGLKRIQSEAIGKGIDRSLLERVVEELEIDWFELAQEAYNKKYSTTPANLEYKDKAKRVRYLMYRGFSYEQIDFAMQAQ